VKKSEREYDDEQEMQRSCGGEIEVKPERDCGEQQGDDRSCYDSNRGAADGLYLHLS